MFSSFLSFLGADLAVYFSGERILIGTQTNLLANQACRVALHKATRKVLTVGDEALGMEGKEPDNIEVIQPFKNGTIQDFDSAEAALRYLVKKHAPRKLIPPRIVVCGQLSSDSAKRALKEVTVRAGAREVMLLETPMAAAMGVGLKIEEPAFHIIMNFERDWLEIAVTSLAGIAARATEPVGFTNLLQDISLYATEALGLSPNRSSLEATLRSTGFDSNCSLIGWEAWIDSLERGRERVSELNASAMTKACTPTLLRIRDTFKGMMDQLPKEKRMLLNAATIHLTGDFSGVPGVTELFSRRLDHRVKTYPNSTRAAYDGTAMVLSELNDLLPCMAAKIGSKTSGRNA